jgi:drug/metabolite transporter (DMT)-like permease
VFLGEPVTVRLALASAAILGGVALVILHKQRAAPVAAPTPRTTPGRT